MTFGHTGEAHWAELNTASVLGSLTAPAPKVKVKVKVKVSIQIPYALSSITQISRILEYWNISFLKCLFTQSMHLMVGLVQ